LNTSICVNYDVLWQKLKKCIFNGLLGCIKCIEYRNYYVFISLRAGNVTGRTNSMFSLNKTFNFLYFRIIKRRKYCFYEFFTGVMVRKVKKHAWNLIFKSKTFFKRRSWCSISNSKIWPYRQLSVDCSKFWNFLHKINIKGTVHHLSLSLRSGTHISGWAG